MMQAELSSYAGSPSDRCELMGKLRKNEKMPASILENRPGYGRRHLQKRNGIDHQFLELFRDF